MSLLTRYLETVNGRSPDAAPAALYAMLDHVASVSPSVASAIVKEFDDQRSNVKLIASENYCSLATQFAQGTLFTDKYAEGYPAHRFYAGCENVDAVEAEAAQLARDIFGAEHAYVQPHSGADANLLAYLAILTTRVEEKMLEKLGIEDPSKVERADWNKIREATHNQRMLGLDYYSGGHLTHGYRHNYSSQLFDAYTYTVNKPTMLLDLDDIRRQAREIKPLVLLAGYSAYSRKIDFAKLREIADEVGAVLMVDMAHFAGLVAGGVFEGNYNPVPFAHVVTTTTHKTLRGPRGGMILCTEEFTEAVDKGCPIVLGGPLPHALAAKAVALREASQPSFKDYARRIVQNSQALAEACMSEGMEVLTRGTDNHLLLIDVQKSFGLTGRQAETAIRECRLTLNRNAVPFDANGPWYTSGLRVGTPAVTTLGMTPADMKEIASVFKLVLSNTKPSIMQKGPEAGQPSRARYQIAKGVAETARERVTALLDRYPVYPEIDLELIRSAAQGWGEAAKPTAAAVR